MVCVTLSALGEQIGSAGGNSVIPRPDLQIGYISTTQPGVCAPSQLVLLSQSEMSQLTSAVTDLQKGLTLKVQPYEATADDYAAITAIFVVALAAGAVIWGLKQVLKLLRNQAES